MSTGFATTSKRAEIRTARDRRRSEETRTWNSRGRASVTMSRSDSLLAGAFSEQPVVFECCVNEFFLAEIDRSVSVG